MRGIGQLLEEDANKSAFSTCFVCNTIPNCRLEHLQSLIFGTYMFKLHFRWEHLGTYISVENLVASHSNVDSLALLLLLLKL